MLDDKEFDICEFSMSSFLMAKERGMDIIGIPIFPRRLFSASQMFVHPDSGIEHPKDLAGKKVVLSSFQTTLSLLAKGDLKFEYGLPWEEVKWFVTTKEKVEFEKKKGVHIEPLEHAGGPRRAPGAGRCRCAVLSAPAALGPVRQEKGAAAVPRHEGRGAALLQEIRLFPDHAHHDLEQGARCTASPGC